MPSNDNIGTTTIDEIAGGVVGGGSLTSLLGTGLTNDNGALTVTGGSGSGDAVRRDTIMPGRISDGMTDVVLGHAVVASGETVDYQRLEVHAGSTAVPAGVSLTIRDLTNSVDVASVSGATSITGAPLGSVTGEAVLVYRVSNTSGAPQTIGGAAEFTRA